MKKLKKAMSTWGASWGATIESLNRLETTRKWIAFPKKVEPLRTRFAFDPYEIRTGQARS